MIRKLLAALSALLLLSPLHAKAPQARPALWKVADADTTIWLFGTVHLLPKGIDWFEGPVRRAFEGSDTLVTEIVLRDPAALQPEIMKRALATDASGLRARLPAAARPRYDAALKALGLPPEGLDRYRPWFASLALAELEYKKLGLDPADGSEKTLEHAADAAGKKQIGLEEPAQQIAILASPSEAEQMDYLKTDLADLDDAPRDLSRMVGAWSAGRPQQLAALINKDFDKEPKLKAVLIDQRNARFADWIRGQLGKPGTVFLAVGAGHLSDSPGSVQALLKAKGVKVTRVQ